MGETGTPAVVHLPSARRLQPQAPIQGLVLLAAPFDVQQGVAGKVRGGLQLRPAREQRRAADRVDDLVEQTQRLQFGVPALAEADGHVDTLAREVGHLVGRVEAHVDLGDAHIVDRLGPAAPQSETEAVCVASGPLTEAGWTPLPQGAVLALRRGRELARTDPRRERL